MEFIWSELPPGQLLSIDSRAEVPEKHGGIHYSANLSILLHLAECSGCDGEMNVREKNWARWLTLNGMFKNIWILSVWPPTPAFQRMSHTTHFSCLDYLEVCREIPYMKTGPRYHIEIVKNPGEIRKKPSQPLCNFGSCSRLKIFCLSTQLPKWALPLSSKADSCADDIFYDRPMTLKQCSGKG